MIRTTTIFVQGDPKGQPRPRAFARKMGSTYVARVYDPGTAEAWKSSIATAVFREYPELDHRTLTGPVAVTIRFYFKRPVSHWKRGVIRSNAPVWHQGRPDLDNLAKAVMDALSQLGIWRDDSQVAVLTLNKCYASTKVGAEISIHELAPTIVG